MNLVADVEWARRKATAQAGAVKKRIDQFTGDLEKSAPHFLPTFLEEIARIFAHAGNLTYAKQYFTKARDAERTHNLTIDPERHTQAFTEFAQHGVISAKVLAQEANDAATRMGPQDAYKYFFTLLIAQSRAGEPLYTNALADLGKLAEVAGVGTDVMERDFVAAYVPTCAFPYSSEDLLETVVKVFPTVLANHPELGAVLYRVIPDGWDIDAYIHALQAVGLWDLLRTTPDMFARWLVFIVKHANTHTFFLRETNRDLLDAIEENAHALTGLPLVTDCPYFHLDYLDVFIAAGTQWRPHETVRSWGQFRWNRWLKHHHRDLAHLVKREELCERLVADLDLTDLPEHLDALVSHESTKDILEFKLEAVRQHRIRATGSKQEWCLLDESRRLCDDSEVRELFPELVAEILRIDPAEELAERLRRGTVVEYTWPTLEHASPKIVTDSTTITATYPWVCLQKRTTLHVFNGTNHLKHQLPNVPATKVIPTSDDVFITYQTYNPHASKWMWLSQGTPYTIHGRYYESATEQYTTTINGTLHIGPTPIVHGDLATPPAGFCLGFGPFYAVPEHGRQTVTVLPDGTEIPATVFHDQFTEGTLPGLTIPQASVVAAAHNATINFNDSFTTMATKTTASSPFGVEEGRLYGISLHTNTGYFYVSPLGVFYSQAESPFIAIRKPAGGVWYVRRTEHTHTLFDAVTDTPIAPAVTATGDKHVLTTLTPAAFHQLHIRNETVSKRMRACTTAQAHKLLADPLAILEFADNDATLAAAIAGMIIDISEIFAATITLPALDVIPKPLTHLYATLRPEAESPREIPLPPSPTPEDFSSETRPAIHRLATLLDNPHDKGDVTINFPAGDLVNTVGREKLWLSWLASPGLSLSFVRSYHAFLSWCAEYNVLGTWRRATPLERPTGMDGTRSWKNKTLHLGFLENYAQLWNPHISGPPTEALDETAFDDELFVPKEEFLEALDSILAWHEKRHATGTALTPSWGSATIHQVSTTVASHSTWPPLMWACLFSGANFSPLGYSYSEKILALAKVLGLSQRNIDTCTNAGSLFFDNSRAILHGISWHENFLTEGPDLEKVCSAWTKMWGTPWIHITDDMWETIPLCFRDNLDVDFHRKATDKHHLAPMILKRLFPLYICLAHTVEPATSTAHAIAARLNQAAQFTDKGVLDTLIVYLRTGTPIAGIRQDPVASAPDVVADVAKTLNLSDNAARYFLQLLALTSPTDADVKKWNKWNKKHLDQAREELVNKSLVITAQRTGAGRSVFLPGGWLNKKDTGTAMETWKAPHYLLWEEDKGSTTVKSFLPVLPHPHLFEQAWGRYKTGDTPGYEELTTTRHRTTR